MSPNARSPVAFGPYVITRRIARGGMAEIYRARTRGKDPSQTRWVALKLMRSSLGHEELRLNLFDREARIATKLHHKNVVPIYAHGQEMGRPYIAMEYMQGRDLSYLLKNEKKGREAVPYLLALYVGLLAARGLGHAHRQVDEQGQPLDIVHRDISPGNVMIGYDGTVKVLDFGVARMNETQGFHTQTGTLRGKFAYMSPEQTLGEDLDARSDVFSLGTLLYELLTGINCFRAANPIATLERVQGLRPVPPGRVVREIPKPVDKILARCLAKDRRRRFKDGTALAEAIEGYLADYGYDGCEALQAHMEAQFSWEKHEEKNELAREEEEVALFDVVDFALLSNPSDLDAKNLAISREEEASQSQVEGMVRPSAPDGSGVFEPEAEAEPDPILAEPVAPVLGLANLGLPNLEMDEDATVAQPAPLAFEDQPQSVGAQVEMSSLLLGPQDVPTDPPGPAPAPPFVESPTLAAPPPVTTRSSPPEALLVPPLASNRVMGAAAAALVLAAGVAAYGLSQGPDGDQPPVAIRPTTVVQPVTISLRPQAASPKAKPVKLDELPEGDAALNPRAKPELPAVVAVPLPRAQPTRLRRPRPRVRPVSARARPTSVKVRTKPKARPSRKPRRSKKAIVGYLNVGAKPWAEIRIDGKPWPYQTPQAGIELKPGKHQVTLHNPETGVTHKTAVYIKSGAYKTVMMDMRKNR